jgi:phosphate transport system permease protein
VTHDRCNFIACTILFSVVFFNHFTYGEIIIRHVNSLKNGTSDKIAPIILGIIAVFSILATIGIIVTLLT